MMRSFSYEPESSSALGLGFRCGFLGLLHLEIITERLEREFDVSLITTTPGVIYKVHTTTNKILDLQNPTNMPDPSQIEKIEEPWIKSTIITPDEYLGSIIKICQDKEEFKLIYLILEAGQYYLMIYHLMKLCLILMID